MSEDDVRDRAADVLKRLVELEGVYGACIVSRDGLPVLSEWPHTANVDTVAAMGAALMGAAETSLLEFGDRTIETVLVVSEGMRLVILGIDDDVLLLAALDRSLPIETFDQTLRMHLVELEEILAEA